MHKNIFTHTLVALFTSFLLSSCASMGLLGGNGALTKIERGQTKQEVNAIMKTSPDYRRFMEDGLEQWEYHTNLAIDGDYDVILISFRDGKVVAMDSFRYHSPQIIVPEQKRE